MEEDVEMSLPIVSLEVQKTYDDMVDVVKWTTQDDLTEG